MISLTVSQPARQQMFLKIQPVHSLKNVKNRKHRKLNMHNSAIAHIFPYFVICTQTAREIPSKRKLTWYFSIFVHHLTIDKKAIIGKNFAFVRLKSTSAWSTAMSAVSAFFFQTLHYTSGANCVQLGVSMGGSQTFSILHQPINTDCHSSRHALCRCTWKTTTRLRNLSIVTIISNVAIAPIYFQVALPRKTLARWEAKECIHHKFEISIKN